MQLSRNASKWRYLALTVLFNLEMLGFPLKNGHGMKYVEDVKPISIFMKLKTWTLEPVQIPINGRNQGE